MSDRRKTPTIVIAAAILVGSLLVGVLITHFFGRRNDIPAAVPAGARVDGLLDAPSGAGPVWDRRARTIPRRAPRQVAGLAWVDASDAGVAAYLDLNKELASASNVSWVADLSNAQNHALVELNTAYTRAVRDLLK